MPPFQKYGLILLACFVFIVGVADLLASVNLNFKERLPSLQAYLPQYFVYTPANASNPNLNPPYKYNSPASMDLEEEEDSLLGSGSAFVPTAVLPATYLKLTSNSVQKKRFLNVCQAFPWTEFEDVAGRNYTSKRLEYTQLFIEELMHFLELEPPIPINQTCLAPALPSADEIDCSQWSHAFGEGVKRARTPKIGVLVQFGFDVDVLEIHLNELYDVVDQFFIIESTHAHYGHLKKPLMWARVQQQERFRKFPVTHFIIDDAEAAHTNDKIWSMEALQEKMRWDKFLEWNDATKFFQDDDLLGFGDADEIPSRANVNLLKYCEFPGESIDIGIWFPYGHIHQTFRTDFPIRGHPLTLGDPTFFTLQAAKNIVGRKPPYPTRRRGGSPNYLLGGMHMTHYGYLPFQLVKYATATESGIRTRRDVERISKYFKNGDMRKMELDMAATPKAFQTRRLKPVNLTNPEMKEICVLPWFYDCNRGRYPVWEDKHDTRLD